MDSIYGYFTQSDLLTQSDYCLCAQYLLAFAVSLLIHLGGTLVRRLFLAVLTAVHSLLYPLSSDDRSLCAEVEDSERQLLTLHPMRDFVARARLERRLVVLHSERDSRLSPRVAARARLELLAVGGALVARALLAPAFLLALYWCSVRASGSASESSSGFPSKDPSQAEAAAGDAGRVGELQPALRSVPFSILAISPQSVFLLCNLMLFVIPRFLPAASLGTPSTPKPNHLSL